MKPSNGFLCTIVFKNEYAFMHSKGVSGLIVLIESAAAGGMTKPVICPKCGRGKLGNMPEWCVAVLPKRGKLPPGMDAPRDCVQVKCPKCKTLWTMVVAA